MSSLGKGRKPNRNVIIGKKQKTKQRCYHWLKVGKHYYVIIGSKVENIIEMSSLVKVESNRYVIINQKWKPIQKCHHQSKVENIIDRSSQGKSRKMCSLFHATDLLVMPSFAVSNLNTELFTYAVLSVSNFHAGFCICLIMFF